MLTPAHTICFAYSFETLMPEELIPDEYMKSIPIVIKHKTDMSIGKSKY